METIDLAYYYLDHDVLPVWDYLEKNQVGFHDIWEHDGIIEVEIHWGDWKHEHARCDLLMEKFGYAKTDEDVTEQDGSDCYSAIHSYRKENE